MVRAKHFCLILVLLFIGSSAAFGKVKGEEVEYSANGTTLKGYLAYDDSIKGKRPGVLVVHEWWGHNDYARKRANMLAGLGYTALAVDMYGNGEQADHPEKAGELSGNVMKDLDNAQKRFEAGMDFLKKQNTVDPERIAAVGYCFGGAVVLTMALRGVDLDGVASFHGMLPTTAPDNANAKAKIIVFHGGSDPFVKDEDLQKFKEVMKNSNADYEVIVYPNAKHSFTNPNADESGKKFDLPLEYNAEADKKSWEKMQEFLKKIFQPENN
ncbi:dienelactone hydrolase family protein [Desulfobacterota bacterium AH_259_B03_O07]|nr:dienelactone hydrolase family protein [Desulfobacterota bacterium AH_259_B03_O07]